MRCAGPFSFLGNAVVASKIQPESKIILGISVSNSANFLRRSVPKHKTESSNMHFGKGAPAAA